MPDLFYDSMQTEIGELMLGVDGEGRVRFIGFANPETILSGFSLVRAQGRCDAIKKQLAEYFSGQRHRFELEYVLKGTEFQKQVFEAVVSVPFGEVITYAELARRIGNPRAVRAVGNAVGANRIAIVVPCHRIVPRSGQTGGFRWGNHRKEFLLALERGR